jgi:1-acyl-sn-glycerol-3-phosphate acyltransferase
VRVFALYELSAPAARESACGSDRGGREALPNREGVPFTVNVQPNANTGMAPLVGREALITAITTFLGGWDPGTLDEIRSVLMRELDAAGPSALARLSRGLASAGADWEYYPRDPLARRIHHVLADRILLPDSKLLGVEHLSGLAGTPLVICANHLSYADANLLEVLLHRSGADPLCDRLTVIAGPKVYSSLKRRFSSLCFGTIKTPQSSARSSEDAVMDAREVARAARRTIEIAHDRLRNGDTLLVFGEGTRSRTCEMQPMLPAVTRYLEIPGTLMLPVGIIGTEALFPIGEDALHAVRVEVRVGSPIPADEIRERAGGDRREMMDIVGRAVASLLPLTYRGQYGAGPVES